MSQRLLTGLAAFALLVGPISANDKKKAPATPETAPPPVSVPATLTYDKFQAPAPILPSPRPADSRVVPSAGVTRPLLPSPSTLLKQLTLPSPHYLEGHLPQYFPQEPQFPLPRELSYQEEAACLPNPVPVKLVAGRMALKTYSVGDLVVPLPKPGDSPNRASRTLEADLIKSITATIAPKSWRAAGGEGSIEYFPLGMALVVNATPDVLAAIEKYLDAVRQMNDLQIQVEVQVVTLSAEALAKTGFGADFLPSKDHPDAIRTRMKFMSREQLAEALVGHPEVNTMTSPKLTLLNGQEGSVRVGEVQHFLTGVTVQSMNNAIVMLPRNEPHETGIDLKIEGTVSADKRFVKLSINGKARDVAVQPVAQIPITVPVAAVTEKGKVGEKVPFTQFIEDPKFITRSVVETVTVPDGGTVVFYGGKAEFEKTVREKMPMLADVPVLAELFSKDQKKVTTDHLLFIATTRVVNPHAGTEECDVPCCAKADGKLGPLMAAYAQACKDGKSADALKLAVECLAIDPTCFGKR